MSRGCQEAPSFLPRVTPTIYTFRLQTAFLAIFYSLKLSFLYLQTDLFAINIPTNCPFFVLFDTIYTFELPIFVLPPFIPFFGRHLYLQTPFFGQYLLYIFGHY